MRVLFLGTGTSHGVPMIGCDCGVCRSEDPHDKRTRPSIVVELDNGMHVLVDTTPDLRTQALAQNLRRVDALLYTHSHADHVFGLDEIRRFNALGKSAMPIFGDAATLADLRRIFRYALDPDAPAGGGVPNLRLWTLGGPFCIGPQEIVPVPIWHGQRLILGYRFGRFAYLTDCSGIPDSSMELLQGLDVLVLDALRRRAHPTHFNLDQAVDMAHRLRARQTYFTHITHDLGHVETCASLPPGMALAHDGLNISIATTCR